MGRKVTHLLELSKNSPRFCEQFMNNWENTYVATLKLTIYTPTFSFSPETNKQTKDKEKKTQRYPGSFLARKEYFCVEQWLPVVPWGFYFNTKQLCCK